ncbi:LIM and SH3 domain protein 1 [Pitangus sulphuratus]|nr:LIM and SH3 domain protein 1 [Pitangus sulphuratus]
MTKSESFWLEGPFWHKACFHCETCKMTLNMKNYKGYEKKPYCNAHYPKQSFTMVADTPENLRLKQQSELQSQIRYKEEFEKNKGKGFSVVADTPELQRIKKTQDQISNKRFRAVYDYNAADEDEVSFQDGDTIINVQQIDDGWMYGTVERTGDTGMLPANYVEAI